MAFIEHPRHILSRNQLLESLWDVNSDYVDEMRWLLISGGLEKNRA